MLHHLAATVFLCLDDGLDFPLDCGCELEVFLHATGRDALVVCTTSFFSSNALGTVSSVMSGVLTDAASIVHVVVADTVTAVATSSAFADSGGGGGAAVAAAAVLLISDAAA